MLTSCTGCGRGYEAGSEEQSSEPVRLCFECRKYLCPNCGSTQPRFGCRHGWHEAAEEAKPKPYPSTMGVVRNREGRPIARHAAFRAFEPKGES